MNVFHSVEKIEKILFAEPGSTDMEIYMEGSRYCCTISLSSISSNIFGIEHWIP